MLRSGAQALVMSEPDPDVTLGTLHDDLTTGFAEMRTGFANLKGEMRTGFADLKVTLITGFRGLPTRESSEEMLRLLREGHRLNEERFTQLDSRIREQHLENQQAMHAVFAGLRQLDASLQRSERQDRRRHRRLVESQQRMQEEQRSLSVEVKALSVDINALIARIDNLIRGRGNGEPAA